MTSSHRLEALLVAQQSLRRQDPRTNWNHLFEIELAIAEITSGESNAHTATVETWCGRYLQGSAA